MSTLVLNGQSIYCLDGVHAFCHFARAAMKQTRSMGRFFDNIELRSSTTLKNEWKSFDQYHNNNYVPCATEQSH